MTLSYMFRSSDFRPLGVQLSQWKMRLSPCFLGWKFESSHYHLLDRLFYSVRGHYCQLFGDLVLRKSFHTFPKRNRVSQIRTNTLHVYSDIYLLQNWTAVGIFGWEVKGSEKHLSKISGKKERYKKMTKLLGQSTGKTFSDAYHKEFKLSIYRLYKLRRLDPLALSCWCCCMMPFYISPTIKYTYSQMSFKSCI